MDIYTLNRDFQRIKLIDAFESSIWTERYYGDGDFELVVEASDVMKTALSKGQLMECEGSDEPMILETREIKGDILKATGITLTKWLNNRIFRIFSTHSIKEVNSDGKSPGETISWVVQKSCVAGSEIFDGSWPIGIPVPQVVTWIVPGLIIGTVDSSGADINISIPFGPVYDIIRPIAETYEIGMKLVLESVTADDYEISFNTYKGLDRSSTQTVRPTIRFSPEMDTLDSIQDLDSVADSKTHIYVFASNADPAIITTAGYASNWGGATGFDLRVMQDYADDIDSSALDAAGLAAVLNQKAAIGSKQFKAVKLVDGTIIETERLKYGTHYFLGDIVEIEGNTGNIQKARITEYIRSQSSESEETYPTLEMID